MYRDFSPDAFLLDMDGTLIDSEPYWIQSEIQLANKWGISWSKDQAKSLVGNSFKKSCNILRNAGIILNDDEFLQYFMKEMTTKINKCTLFRPGAKQLLDILRKLKIPTALVTMSYRPIAQAFIDKLPKNTFTVSVTGDMVEKGKPDPAPYIYAVSLLKEKGLKINIEKCIAIEDSIPGVKSALSSGAITIGIPFMHSLEGFKKLHVWNTLTNKNMQDFIKLMTLNKK